MRIGAGASERRSVESTRFGPSVQGSGALLNVAQKVCGRDAEPIGESNHDAHAWVTLASFDPSDIAEGKTGAAGNLLLR